MSSHDSGRLSDNALSGFSNAVLYDEHRPSYPPHAVATLLDAAGVSNLRGARLIDLAAGTGKFTELLAARQEQFNIVAVEPHSGMREELVRKDLKNVIVNDGLSTSIPAGNNTIDAVFVAQAFHWFANEESLLEIHRVLKPGGGLGLIWNAEDYNTPSTYPIKTEWATTLRRHLFALDDVTGDREPRFRHDRWRKAFEDQVSSTPITAALVGKTSSLFSLPLGEQKVEWTVWLDKEGLWKRLSTLSHVANLVGEKLEETRRIFDEALAGIDVERNQQGQVAVHGTTVVVWASKIP
ncbi:methyltransferase [Aaosphaeria arxii CBS 175.79]|uniref:Methyltransferase n=1 Tax=Aaosphaeria arxii CBS 175.79 TaxID=1450172 RepID=A0A6A5XTT8_9PLEO|nr:methyltransferase [Aaosphaeria arxii CBS 175.79]KAF2016070.1 methyltransferase [Aaosphaeria arxii CBS 175.79]